MLPLWITLVITTGGGAVSFAVAAQEPVSSVDEPVSVQSRSESLGFKVTCMTRAETAGQPVLFLHGTPGGAEIFTGISCIRVFGI